MTETAKTIRTYDRSQAGPPQYLVDVSTQVNNGNYTDAIDTLKANIDQNPFVAYKGLGDIYLLLKDYEQALNWLQRAQQEKPESIDVIINVACALGKLDRIDEMLFSESASRLIVEVSPENEETFVRMTAKIPVCRLGVVSDGRQLRIADPVGGQVICEGIADLKKTWKTSLKL